MDVEEMLESNERDYIISRHRENVADSFSMEQLAFLYLLDPIGVCQYVQECKSQARLKTADSLNYKDTLYEMIFGCRPIYYKYDDNGHLLRVIPTPESRENCFSSAEAIFGAHISFNLSTFFHDFVTGILEIAVGVIPYVDQVTSIIKIMHTIFFAGSIMDLSPTTGEYISEYYDGKKNSALTKDALKYAENMKWWTKGVFAAIGVAKTLYTSIVDNIVMLNECDMEIYKKVDTTSYSLNFVVDSDEISIKDIIKNAHT